VFARREFGDIDRTAKHLKSAAMGGERLAERPSALPSFLICLLIEISRPIFCG
jgi:hypothetical protein